MRGSLWPPAEIRALSAKGVVDKPLSKNVLNCGITFSALEIPPWDGYLIRSNACWK